MTWPRGWPIHRKLVAIALVVTMAALLAAMGGVVAVDVWQYQEATAEDTTALARLIAANTSAAVVFGDAEAAERSLATVRVRPTVRLACLYLPDGSTFAGFTRSPDISCPERIPEAVGWRSIASTAEVSSPGRVIGLVYVEQDRTELWKRLGIVLTIGLVMLLAGGGLAMALASRLHRTVSGPLAQLASAARATDPDARQNAFAAVASGGDEAGDLARALADMMRRLGEATDELRRHAAEREHLLSRERAASRLKDEFLAAVSHELRTPLNAILGWVQVLGRAGSPDVLARGLASIDRNARAQARVIEDLVDVSRIVTGKLSLRSEPFDLRCAVEAAADAARPAAQAKRIALEVQVPDAVCLVNGDPDRLQQVVANLLSNALKFTAAGGSVSVVARDLGFAYELTVTDSGIGMAPEFLPVAFDRFRQADGSLTREHGGLGLGLAIVKEITELHGGSVGARSSGPGRGSTFTVRLPALIGVQHSVTVRRELWLGAPENLLAGVRVLAVDDNADTLDVLAVALRSSGAEVRTASSGPAAIAEWEREPADVLLCDLAMPGMDGFEVLDRIRQLDARSGRVTPAVAISAHATEDSFARSRRAGFAAHVAKPYRIQLLMRAIRDALEIPRAEAADPSRQEAPRAARSTQGA